jgi:hypothetical protein
MVVTVYRDGKAHVSGKDSLDRRDRGRVLGERKRE